MTAVGLVDGNGHALDGSQPYTLHFSKAQLPPAKAFWSLAAYAPDMTLVRNRIERYSLGDRDGVRFNADGSLDLVLQKESPGAEWESNWLPTPPSGCFVPVIRAYWPSQLMLDERWRPPKLCLLQ